MNRLKLKHLMQRWSLRFVRMHEHPPAVRLQQHFPRLYRWLLLRLDPHHFRGLPLTVLCIGIALNMLVLSELAEELVEWSPLRKIDLALADFVFAHRDNRMAAVVFVFSRLCSSPVVLALLGGCTVLAVWQRRLHALMAIFSALVASSATALAGKGYFRMPRPEALAWYDEFSWSYPSGHATVAVAFYGLLFYLLLHTLRHRRLKQLVRIIAVCFILMMGGSRIYLCVHYLSDVLAGYAVGLLWFLFSVSLLSWLDFRREQRRI